MKISIPVLEAISWAASGVSIRRCSDTHYQAVRHSQVLVDIWPTTCKFRVHDAPEKTPAVKGCTEDVLTVIDYLTKGTQDR